METIKIKSVQLNKLYAEKIAENITSTDGEQNDQTCTFAVKFNKTTAYGKNLSITVELSLHGQFDYVGGVVRSLMVSDDSICYQGHQITRDNDIFIDVSYVEIEELLTKLLNQNETNN